MRGPNYMIYFFYQANVDPATKRNLVTFTYDNYIEILDP
jgi:hypothetical protein